MNEVIRSAEKVSVALGLAVIGLLAANFVVHHELSEASRLRFVLSGTLLAGTALYFRFGLRETSDLARAAYRIAATNAFWSVGYAIYPYPGGFLYLIVLPAFFFLYRAETKRASAAADVIAAGLLFALGVLLYVEQQPLQVVLFPERPFQWGDYYDNAPVLLLSAVGLARVARWSSWKGLALVGALLFATALVLVLSEGARPFLTLPVPLEIVFGVALGHVLFAVALLESPVAATLFRFTGIDASRRSRFRAHLYAVGNALLLSLLPFILVLGGGAPETLPLAAATLAGGLYYFRPESVGFVTAALACFLFPVAALFYPSVDPAVLTIVLATLLVAAAALRRAYGRAGLPDWAFVVGAVAYLGSLAGGEVWSPRGLVFLGVLAGCWVALPDRPGNVPAAKHYLLWPPVAALVLLCLNRGFAPLLLPLWASASILPPLVLVLLISFGSGRSALVRAWRDSSEPALAFLSYFAGALAALGFLVDYRRIAVEWLDLALVLSVLLAGVGIHLRQTWTRVNLRSAISAEVFLLLSMLLIRYKVARLGVLERATPLDGYLLLAASALASGVREVVRRRARELQPHLLRSSVIYGLLGWMVSLWMRWETGTPWHAEVSSLFVSGLFFWFALRGARRNLIPAFVFANVTSVLLFYRLDWYDPQFYVIPAAGSALALAQLFRKELDPRRLAAIRLVCGLAALGTSSVGDVLSFNASYWYPLSAALISAAAVVVGISLRVRIYLYLGTSFFLFNTFTVLAQVIKNQSPEQVKLLIGVVFLLVGFLFTGSFVVFQMKRQEILDRYRNLLRELQEWE